MKKILPSYSTYIFAGFIILGIASLLPIANDVSWKPHPEFEYKVNLIPQYGLVSLSYWLNIFFMIIPVVIGYKSSGNIAKVFIVIISLFCLILTKFGTEFSVFHWSGPFSGKTDFGVYFIYIGDIVLAIGAFLASDQIERIKQ